VGQHVEILRDGRKDSAIHEDELEAVLVDQFDFRIERDQAGNISKLRRLTLHDDMVLVYEAPSTLWMQDPDTEALQLMIRIAGALRKGARVRNDEYQTYLTADQTYTHPHDAEHFKLDASPATVHTLSWHHVLRQTPKVLLLLAISYYAGKLLLANLGK